MNKSLFLLFLFVFAAGVYAQTLNLPLKVYGVGESIQTEVGEWYTRNFDSGYNLGHIWNPSNYETPTLQLVHEDTQGKNQYELRVILYNSKGTYVPDMQYFPLAILQDNAGNLTSLKCDPETPCVSYAKNKQWDSVQLNGAIGDGPVRMNTEGIPIDRLSMQTDYCTILSYVIPDIQDLASREYVKLSFCGGNLEYDMREAGDKTVKVFNKKLKKGVKYINKQLKNNYNN